jgi:prepilin-type N-terminal cleavage/methylation domain-containing protein
MRAIHPKRHGFTLVELLVVIVIIGILAALISVAVSAAVSKARQTAIQTEMNQLASALQVYKTKYGSYPPNTTAALQLHVRSNFPRALPGDIATIPTNLTPAEILWFCVRGYTNDPQRPVDFFNPNAPRTGEFEFDQGRLVQTRTFQHNSSAMTPLQAPRVNNQPVWVYVPQQGKGAPYVYFDCSRAVNPTLFANSFYRNPNNANDTARPYLAEYLATSGNPTVKRANEGKFQIISAGLDGLYGDEVADATDLSKYKFYPSGVNYTEGDKDNLVNFSERSLEDAKP